MLATQVLGAIAFDPNIRGVLIVLTGTVVLMGSVFMILATNSGARVGFMLAAAGLFGWLAILGMLWTINPGGLKGRGAAWMPAEINYNRLDSAGKAVPVATPQLNALPTPDTLADPEALLESKPLLHALALGAEGKDYTPTTLTKLKTLISPGSRSEPGRRGPGSQSAGSGRSVDRREPRRRHPGERPGRLAARRHANAVAGAPQPARHPVR